MMCAESAYSCHRHALCLIAFAESALPYSLTAESALSLPLFMPQACPSLCLCFIVFSALFMPQACPFLTPFPLRSQRQLCPFQRMRQHALPFVQCVMLGIYKSVAHKIKTFFKPFHFIELITSKNPEIQGLRFF